MTGSRVETTVFSITSFGLDPVNTSAPDFKVKQIYAHLQEQRHDSQLVLKGS